MFVCIYVCIYLCMYVCTRVYMYLSIYVCMYVYIYICIYICIYIYRQVSGVSGGATMHRCFAVNVTVDGFWLLRMRAPSTLACTEVEFHRLVDRQWLVGSCFVLFECKKSNLSNYTLKVYFQFRFHSHCTTILSIRGNASDDNHQPRIQMSPSHLLGSQSLVKSQSSHLWSSFYRIFTDDSFMAFQNLHLPS